MADELLTYYEKELAFIRQLGSRFSEEHPKIAARLGINNDIIEDPHVSRLIESFAYLTARIQHKLDDDFPELTDALLTTLFPHYQRPIPSTSIALFQGDKEQLDSHFLIEKNTLLETPQFQGENCQFTTIYPVDLYPIIVKEAKLMGRPFNTPGSAKMKGAGAVLKLTLSTYNEGIHFSDLSLKKLRFYLKGQSQHIHPLYQILLKDCQNLVLANADDDVQPVFCGPDNIKPVGFSHDEGLLPYPASSFLGYRLLTEYFVFPEKFMFIDIINLDQYITENTKHHLELYIYLTESDLELEHHIDHHIFQLGCTPIINLFEHRADPIKLNHHHHEYEVVADVRRPQGYEIYSIDSVVATSTDGNKQDFQPIYGVSHQQHKDHQQNAFWFASRRHAKLNDQERDEATDMFISLVDLGFNPNKVDNRTLTLQTICSNRNLPEKLPFNNEQPSLQVVEGAPPCSKIRCMTQPSAAVRPPLRNQARWRLISHLNLNFLSLTGQDNATEALKEILRLYDFRESSATKALIESILDVSIRTISAPLMIDGRSSLCRGSEITVTLDGILLTGSSSYLFASILEHFFALYCSINSFTRVLVKLKNQEGYLKKCPPRAGEKILL